MAATHPQPRLGALALEGLLGVVLGLVAREAARKLLHVLLRVRQELLDLCGCRKFWGRAR
jgi:hypothetical protein